MTKIVAALMAIAAGCWVSLAAGQSYPSRPVRIIQPLGVGTPGDIASRAIAQSLSQTFGQPVLVENRVGANGVLGMDACAKAAPDGYTICVPSYSQVSLNPFTYAKLPYDPPRDLAPVILIGFITSSISVHPSVPVNSVPELVELAKSKPGALNWASWGIGSFSHLYLAWLQSNTGASFTHVPYKTLDQAMSAVVAGEAQVLMNTPGLIAPLVKAGRLKALAIAGHKRSPLLEVPTLKEQGFDVEFLSWVGVFVPSGTPKEVVQRLNSEMGKLVSDAKFAERVLLPISVEPVGGSPEDFAVFLKKDRDIAAKIAKLANLRPE